MTVRITKPKFNLREKLTELDKPTGIKGSELMRSDTAQEVRGLIGADRKNLAINGDMRITQRGTGAFTVNSSYGADRWRTMFGAGGFNTQNVTDAPVGFNNSIKITQTSYGSASYKMIEQYIEGYNIRGLGYGTAEAKTATLSFFVKGSVAGIYGVTIQNAATGGSRVSYVSSYTINRPNVWEYKTVKIFPPTSYTWYNDNQRGIGIIFSLGSTGYATSTLNQWQVANLFDVTGAIDLGNFAGATLQLTGVQYEIGENATDFEHRPYTEELALCQRYFSIYHPTTQEWIYFEASNNNHKWWQTYIPTGMRGEPTATPKGTCDTNNIAVVGGGTISDLAVQAIDNGGNSGTTHPGSMGRVSYRVTFSGSFGNAYEIRHTDGWGNGAGWVEYNSEL